MAKLTKAQKEEMELVWENIKTGVARNQHWKSRMFALYNEIHRTNYKGTTNCSSCIGSVYRYFTSKMKKPKVKKDEQK